MLELILTAKCYMVVFCIFSEVQPGYYITLIDFFYSIILQY